MSYHVLKGKAEDVEEQLNELDGEVTIVSATIDPRTNPGYAPDLIVIVSVAS